MLDCRLVPHASIGEAFLVGFQMGTFASGAVTSVGVCERAGPGTLVLAEITALSREAQAILVRVMTERRMRPVGANRNLPFDANVIATTTCEPGELDELMTRGLFDRRLISLLGERTRLAPVREREGEIERALPHGLPKAFRARLAKLAWRTNYYGLAALSATMSEEDVLECELIDALESAPHDEAPRAVFADFCEERRRPARADEVHEALRAEEAMEQRPPRRLAKADPPAEDVEAERGYIARIATAPSRIMRLEHLFRLAPALREVELIADRAPDDWPHLFARKFLRRLRSIRVQARPEQHVVIRASAPPGLRVEVV